MKSVQQTSPELLFEILNHKRVCIRDAAQRGAFSQVFLNDFYDKCLESDCNLKILKLEDVFYLSFLLLILKYASSQNLATSISRTIKGKDRNQNTFLD